MENLEVFDKNGKQININDVIFDYLKNNLTIDISTKTERDYDSDDKYNCVKIVLLLNNKEISKCETRL